MKAVIATQYGAPEVLKINDIKKPDPKDNEVLVKVMATSVTSGDVRIRSLEVPKGFKTLTKIMFGFSKPKVIGLDFAGIVEKVGNQVTEFKVGDKVFGSRFGANAEYICIKEKAAISLMPENLSFEESASLPFGFSAAIYFLKKRAKVSEDQKVLIYGASGSVGIASVQLAKYLKAEVTGVCSSKNIELAKSMGAHKLIDYTKTDFRNSEEKYDLVFDTIGKSTFDDCKHLLSKNGKYAQAVASLPDYLKYMFNKSSIVGTASDKKENLIFIKTLAEAKQIKPVIDKVYKLDQIVEAHRYVEGGHKVGNIVIII